MENILYNDLIRRGMNVDDQTYHMRSRDTMKRCWSVIHKAHQGKGLAAELIGYETCKGSMFHNPASPDRFLKKPSKYEFAKISFRICDIIKYVYI